MECAELGFTFTTAQQVAENIAQTLAYSETQGSCWLRGSLAAVHLVPNSATSCTRAQMRVVMRVNRTEVARMLSVDRWVSLQTFEMDAKVLERHDVPQWIISESVDGSAHSNLACAKHLAELLLLLLDKMTQIAHQDHRTFASWFWHTINNTKHEDQMPPALNYSQRIGLMDLADAWRDHIVSVWQSVGALPPLPPLPPLPSLPPLPPLPPLNEKVLHEEPPLPPKLDAKEFPALGASPGASPGALRERATLDCTKVHSTLDPDCSVCIPKINQDDAARLWRVAWLGDSTCNEALWLRCGQSPQNIAGGY